MKVESDTMVTYYREFEQKLYIFTRGIYGKYYTTLEARSWMALALSQVLSETSASTPPLSPHNIRTRIIRRTKDMLYYNLCFNEYNMTSGITGMDIYAYLHNCSLPADKKIKYKRCRNIRDAAWNAVSAGNLTASIDHVDDEQDLAEDYIFHYRYDDRYYDSIDMAIDHSKIVEYLRNEKDSRVVINIRMMRLFYEYGISLKEIGTMFNKKPDNVSQIIQRTLNELRARFS